MVFVNDIVPQRMFQLHHLVDLNPLGLLRRVALGYFTH